ncbi:MAG: NUDIX domain-containing protein [Bacteroidales bacterium]
MPVEPGTAPYRFCPVCSGVLEDRVIKTGEPKRLVCPDCDFVYYLDPKVAVGTIIRHGESGVVLIRRSIDPGYGKWVFPGGYVDRGEQTEAAAIREAREECGLDVRIEGLISVYSYAGRTPIVIVYAASIEGGTLAAADEALDAKVFEPADIPWRELAFPSTREALEDYLAGARATSKRAGFWRAAHRLGE